MKEDDAALKKNIYKFDELQIAAFSDDCTDGVKVHVFYEKEDGFVNGKDFEVDNLVAYIIDSKNIDNKCSKIAVIINANETGESVKYCIFN